MIDRSQTKFVYFMRPILPSGIESPIKIGCSREPFTRLKESEIWSPFPLEMLTMAPGGHGDERRLHRRFAAVRIRSEWFRATSELMNVIEEIRDTGTLPFTIVGNYLGKLPGLENFLKKHSISRKDLARAAGVPTGRIKQWSELDYHSDAARIIETFEYLGIECTLADLLGEGKDKG